MNYFDPLRQQYANLSGYSDDQRVELAPLVDSQSAGMKPVAQKGTFRRGLGLVRFRRASLGQKRGINGGIWGRLGGSEGKSLIELLGTNQFDIRSKVVVLHLGISCVPAMLVSAELRFYAGWRALCLSSDGSGW